jgi:peptidoglycan/xylan/chitin deacetylase (PgdA/CDA1 family)
MAASAIAGLRPSIPGLPVLLCHEIATGGPQASDKYRVTISNFRAQLEWLRSQRFCALPPQAVADPLRCGRAVILSFDGRMESDYRVAFPLLAENGFPAAFFVNTAEIGKPGRLGWAEMREMQKAGMSFQSHGHHHVDYSLVGLRTAVQQLHLSREMLEQNLGRPADCFSAPYGLLTRRLIRAAHEAGFQFIFSSRNWPVRPRQACAGRFVIYQSTTLGQFRAQVGCAMLPLMCRSLREAALLIPRRLLLRVRPQWLGVAVMQENT